MNERECVGCGVTDDHPRHVIMGQKPWHMDCHALTGCAVCVKQLERCETSTADDGVIGEELRSRLVELDPSTFSLEN